MPVCPKAMRYLVGYLPPIELYNMGSKKYVYKDRNTKLAWLGDWIYIPNTSCIFSPGDLFLNLGVVLMILNLILILIDFIL